MNEPAILEPVVYETIYNDEGQRVGYRPRPEDRRRFEQGSRYPGTGQQAVHPTEPDELPARPLEDVRAELEAWAIGDANLYRQLEALYQERPLIADRIGAAAVRGAQTGGLQNPTAFLASRLRPAK